MRRGPCPTNVGPSGAVELESERGTSGRSRRRRRPDARQAMSDERRPERSGATRAGDQVRGRPCPTNVGPSGAVQHRRRPDALEAMSDERRPERSGETQ